MTAAKWIVTAKLGMFVTVLALIVAACGGESGEDTTTTAATQQTTTTEGAADLGSTTTTTTSPDAETASVSIVPGASDSQAANPPDEYAETESPVDFDINVLTVKVGETVTWTNLDNESHTVSAVEDSFFSGLLDKGETFSQTFSEIGEFRYFCEPHPWMRAKVIVEE